MGPKPPVDATTRRGPTSAAPPPRPESVLTLTILWHPDAARVGEVATLDRTARLSRLEPEFGAPGGRAREPIADAHVSRKPLKLTGAGEDVTIAEGGEAIVDGVPLSGERTLGGDELARGVTIELGERVAVLLQRRAGTVDLSGEIDRLADLATPVLVLGESGAGKERVALALHQAGPRARGPFVAVNLAALAPSLAASQLFGHVKGAFTGAAEAQRGFFREAHGGTLFLDEVGATPPDVQAMMLRVLETGIVQPVGAVSGEAVDVRVVAATDADLEEETRAGRFRAPLFHRLAGYVIRVPPLRARRDDVGRLLVHFLREEWAAAGEQDRLGAEPPWMPAKVAAALARHAWPGNVRELRNVARRMVIASRGSSFLVIDQELARLLAAPSIAPKETIDETRMVAALAAHQWKTAETARALGISRTTLYALMEKSARVRKARDVSREEIVALQAEAGGDVDAIAERLRVSRRGLLLRMKELGLS